MANRNVTIKRWDAAKEDWDNIYPKTSAENIVSGFLNPDRIGDGTIENKHIKRVDAAKVENITGTINVNAIPAIALTNVTTYTDKADFESKYKAGGSHAGNYQEGDIAIISSGATRGTYIYKGVGSPAYNINDFYKVVLPYESVTSVNGKYGAVTIDASTVDLGNVQNVDTTDPSNINWTVSRDTVTTSQKTKWDNVADKVATITAERAYGQVFASPVGPTSGPPSFRKLVPSDLPDHTHNADDITGTLGIEHGGTGAITSWKARENLNALEIPRIGPSSEIPVQPSDGQIYLQIG